jgi:putative membrane protein
MRPSRLIGPADRERIEAAVRAAEAGTSGEIVVHVVGRSDPFAVSAWRLGALLAAMLLLAAGLFAPGLSLLELFAFQCAALTAAHGACASDAVRRLCLGEAELQRAAARGALDAFVRHVARRTEARTGILIYVTLLERRVVVLGEEAIDRALAPGESWDAVVALVLDGLRAKGAGRAADGIVAAVARCGAMLARPLPPSAENRDEIPRGLILAD